MRFAFIETEGFDSLTTIPQGDLTMVRALELVTAINRWRRLEV